MLNLRSSTRKHYSLEDAIHASVSSHLDRAFLQQNWCTTRQNAATERSIREENKAKIELVLEAPDSIEACYRNLIREIDVEAECGIYLVGSAHEDDTLQGLAADPGISGQLHLEVPAVGRPLFGEDLDALDFDGARVWASLKARYARANLDAAVSEVAMRFLLDSRDAAMDMAEALRSMLYSFHEDTVRHLFAMSPVLDERQSRDLLVMVAELDRRSGCYETCTRAIRERARTPIQP
jgi:hypothetical protein